MWILYAVAVMVGIVAIAIMKKIRPEYFGAYLIYVAVILLLLALVFELENAW